MLDSTGYSECQSSGQSVCILETDYVNSLSINHLQDSKNFNPTSPEKCKGHNLNESYTISIGLHQKKELSIISEESLIKYSDSVNSSFPCYKSDINDYENILSADHTFLKHPKLNTKTSNNETIGLAVHKIKQNSEDYFIESDEIKRNSEDDFMESDDSLGILSSAVLEDLPWDNLVSDVEDTDNNLNITVNLNDSPKILSGSKLDKAASTVCHVSDVSFLSHSEESPVQKNATFPQCASTPKHEINFSDISEEIESVLNLTHISKGFHHNSTDDEKDFTATVNDRNVAEKCLNVTLTYSSENEHNSDRTINFESKSSNSCDFQEDKVLHEKTGNILNTTFEKVLELPASNINIKSPHHSTSVSMKENVKLATGNKDKKQINFDKFSNVSLTKDKHRSKVESKNFRKSVSSLGSTDGLRKEMNNMNVRRNSISNSDTSRDNASKIIQLPNSKASSSKPSFQRGSTVNSVTNQERPGYSNSAKNNFNKNTFNCLPARAKSLAYKNENTSTNTPKFRTNQPCLLDETINIATHACEVGKTVVKKPRNSVISFTRRNSEEFNLQEAAHICETGKKSRDSQVSSTRRNSEEFNLQKTALICEVEKTVVKKPRNSVVTRRNSEEFNLQEAAHICETGRKSRDFQVSNTRRNSEEFHLQKTARICEDGKTPVIKKPRNSISFTRRNSEEFNFKKAANICEVGKTVVKKPRNSVLSFNKGNNFDSLQCRSKTTFNKNVIPFKLEKHVGSIAVKNNVTEKSKETFSSSNRTFKKSIAGTSNEKPPKQSRFFGKRLSAQGDIYSSTSSSALNRDLVKHKSISAFKENISNSKKDIKILNCRKTSEKCRVEKVNVNETMLLTDQHSDSRPIEAAKPSNIKRPSCILFTRIPSINKGKLAPQVKCPNANIPSTSKDNDKYTEKEKPSHRMILRSSSSSCKIKTPAQYNAR